MFDTPILSVAIGFVFCFAATASAGAFFLCRAEATRAGPYLCSVGGCTSNGLFGNGDSGGFNPADFRS